MKQKTINLIVIAGGSASGKTTVAQTIADSCNNRSVVFLEMDNYYFEIDKLQPELKTKNNFDHPDAIDSELLISHLQQLLAGKSILQPIYDFTINTRTKKTRTIGPGDVIILDGILALANPIIRQLATIKIFVDTDNDIRLVRRIKRDVTFRKRSLDEILHQYVATVKPMHDAFVEPTKRYADIIIPFDFHNKVAIDLIATKIATIVNK